MAKRVDGFHKIAVTPEKAAAAIVRGVVKNKYLVYTSFDVRFGYWWARKFAFPYEVVMRLANDQFDRIGRLSRVRDAVAGGVDEMTAKRAD